MNKINFLVAASVFLSATAATAQVTYIDADASSNTTNADGTPLTPVIGPIANDNLWQQRPFANGGTIISSNDSGSGTEDCPMLRTTISGLIPTLSYHVYGYQWNTQVDQWRLGFDVDTQQPVGPLSLWHTRGSGTPMSTPLAFDAPTNAVTSLGLQYGATGLETSGHFVSPVMIQEGNRWLFEVPLGVFAADLNGEIHVYVDDDPQNGNFYRNWYDGVGYELAPLPYGLSCGTGEIGFAGQPHGNSNFSVDLTASDPSALALVLVGLNQVPPFDVGTIGFTPGCFLNVDFAFIDVTTTNATGDASWAAQFSGLPAGISPVFFQWATFDATLTLASMTYGLQVDFHP
mgnify:FL=1|tara:strand:+ start:2624 stop:3661 length:1038 start_codon:yes stop_codon:yes gene_type:complete